jgi:hypothetical protein
MSLPSGLTRVSQWMESATMAVMILGLAGCQPEGVGTVKAPAVRGDDSQLGRPFGNAPEVPKKAAPEKATKEVAEPKNPRL